MKFEFKKLLMFFLVLIFIGITIWYSLFDRDKQSASKEVVSNIVNINNIEKSLTNNKVHKLQEYYNNSDILGILSIDGIESFEYPVVKTIDNDYYLNHDYYKKYDAYGAIYADYRSDLDNGDKILIYGHSSSKRDVPFNILENYENKNFYNKHKYITLETEANTYRYEIFSVYVETNDFSYMNMNFKDRGSWYAHIVGLQNKSLFNSDVALGMDEDILILQTCSKNSIYKDYSKKYLLIISRRVK